MRRKAHIHTAADTSQNNTRTDGERATEGRMAYIQQTTHETDSTQEKIGTKGITRMDGKQLKH